MEFDLTRSSEGVLLIANTSSRKTELSAKLDDVIVADKLTPHEAQVIFAESQIFGRTARAALHELGSVATSLEPRQPLGDDLSFSVRWLLEHVVLGSPRKVSVGVTECFHVFLDGACERKNGGHTAVGGVLVNDAGEFVSCFGEELPGTLTRFWAGRGRDDKSVIFEAEVLPFALALAIWSDVLENSCTVVYIHKEGTRHLWINGTADSISARRIIHSCAHVEAQLRVVPYLCMCPLIRTLQVCPLGSAST